LSIDRVMGFPLQSIIEHIGECDDERVSRTDPDSDLIFEVQRSSFKSDESDDGIITFGFNVNYSTSRTSVHLQQKMKTHHTKLFNALYSLSFGYDAFMLSIKSRMILVFVSLLPHLPPTTAKGRLRGLELGGCTVFGFSLFLSLSLSFTLNYQQQSS